MFVRFVFLAVLAVLLSVTSIRCGGSAAPDDDAGLRPESSGPASGTDRQVVTDSPEISLPALETAEFPAQAAVWDHDFPDPFVLLHDGVFHAYATEGTLDAKVQVLRSWDLVRWSQLGEALVDTPAWAAPDTTWAPAVIERDGQFVLFYSARIAGSDTHCISVATGDGPDRRFTDTSSTPLVCPLELGGAIDPSPFVADDGAAYLLWKNDGVTVGEPSAIYTQRLDDGATALVGEPVKLIETDQAWEDPHVEAPSMAVVDGQLVLLYSANWWNRAEYGIGVALCDAPTGPCHKPLSNPVLGSADGAIGPGGAEIFFDASGRALVAYHAWNDDPPGYPQHRALWIDELTIDDGRPRIGG